MCNKLLFTGGYCSLSSLLGFHCLAFFLSQLLYITGRVPFDFSEAESELVSGVSTEFGSISFSLFLIFDYVELLFFYYQL